MGPVRSQLGDEFVRLKNSSPTTLSSSISKLRFYRVRIDSLARLFNFRSAFSHCNPSRGARLFTNVNVSKCNGETKHARRVGVYYRIFSRSAVRMWLAEKNS